jgi:hypothetical protein
MWAKAVFRVSIFPSFFMRQQMNKTRIINPPYITEISNVSSERETVDIAKRKLKHKKNPLFGADFRCFGIDRYDKLFSTKFFQNFIRKLEDEKLDDDYIPLLQDVCNLSRKMAKQKGFDRI